MVKTHASKLANFNGLIILQVVITKADGKTLPDGDRMVAPINNALSSLFSACHMYVNDREIR